MLPPSALPDWRAQRRALRCQLEQLARSVDELAADAQYRALLSGAARLWRYSPCNQEMIRMQHRCATSVRGPREWEAVGRKIRPGEPPLAILAPRHHGGGSPWPPVAVAVYDVSQTEGRALALPAHLEGEAAGLARLLRAPEVLKIRLAWMEPRAFEAGERVLAASLGGTIAITKGLTELKTALCIAHELAHELLHKGGECAAVNSVREAEAHGAAFIVLRALELPCDAPSYIAWQKGSGADILRGIDRISAAARMILGACEGKRLRVVIKDPRKPRTKARRPPKRPVREEERAW